MCRLKIALVGTSFPEKITSSWYRTNHIMELDKVVESARKSINSLASNENFPVTNRVAVFIDEGINLAQNDNTSDIHKFVKALADDRVNALCFSKPSDYKKLVKNNSSLSLTLQTIDDVDYITNPLPNELESVNTSAYYDEIVRQYYQFLAVYRPSVAIILNASMEVAVSTWTACYHLNIPFAFYVKKSVDINSLLDNKLAAVRSFIELRGRFFVPDVQTKEDFINSGLNRKCFDTEKNISNWIAKQIHVSALENLDEHLASTNYHDYSLLKKKINQPNEVKSLIFGNFDTPENIELPQKEPLWFGVPVKEGQELRIEASCEYINVEGVKNRKAVLLINSFDSKGKPVDKSCGNMAKSGHLKAYFKYLPCTNSQLKELHLFKVPKGVTSIQIGLCSFNKKDGELILLRSMRMYPTADKLKASPFIPPSQQAAEISILGWPKLPVNKKPIVVGIMDEFTTGCFEKDVNLIQPRPDNWFALAEKYKPDLFFIESAWKGNFGSWQYRVANYTNKPGEEIAHICQYAKERGIPTLFWNKEDPVHHEKFMCSAKLVEYIFTTDANMKQSYTEKTGNENVYALPFAAQPMLHKPAPLKTRKPKACFAGSWYGNRHAERGEAMGWLLSAAKKYGLDIYDRNYGTGIFPFPEIYASEIKGSLPYQALCEEYNQYRVFLNVNSVTESPTMFSRRVFELMACGTPIVSTYAKGIENMFGSDTVWLVDSQEEADEALHTLFTDNNEWRRRSLAGIREVFARHTYAHRLNDIFEQLGIEKRLKTQPNVTLFAQVEVAQEVETLINFINQQSYENFRVIAITSTDVLFASKSNCSRLNFISKNQLVEWKKTNSDEMDLVGLINTNHYYGPNYLRDLVNASLYEPEADGWAKSIKHDRFCYDQKASIAGAIWHSSKAKEIFNLDINSYLSKPNLYVIDSDQFSVLKETTVN